MCAVVQHRLQSFGALRLVAAVGVLLLAPGLASAYPTFSFLTNITGNDPVDAATGGQYTVTVVGSTSGPVNYTVGSNTTATTVNTGQVLFVFHNSPIGVDSFISDIYFQNGALLNGTLSVINSNGVFFENGASPPRLPGGESIGFTNPATFSADSSTAAANGVNPGESVGILFQLGTGKDYQAVLNSLALGFQDVLNPNQPQGALRIGIHVQGYKSGGKESESFVATVPVPEPSTFAIAGLSGLAMLGYGLRRRKMART